MLTLVCFGYVQTIVFVWRLPKREGGYMVETCKSPAPKVVESIVCRIKNTQNIDPPNPPNPSPNRGNSGHSVHPQTTLLPVVPS